MAVGFLDPTVHSVARAHDFVRPAPIGYENTIDRNHRGLWRNQAAKGRARDLSRKVHSTFNETYTKSMASPTTSGDLRVRSKRLFGNSYMLEVCAALDAVQDRTNLTELVRSSGLSPCLYSGPLQKLLSAGLLTPDRRPEDDRRERWYRPAPTGLWRVARELTT